MSGMLAPSPNIPTKELELVDGGGIVEFQGVRVAEVRHHGTMVQVRDGLARNAAPTTAAPPMTARRSFC